MKVCPRDGEPVVFTFEFPGAEHYCVVCGGKYGIFGVPEAEATVELQERMAELQDQYDRERSERTGLPMPRRDDPPRQKPVCGGCGKTAELVPSGEDKPRHWYSRTRDGVTSYACSRGCIPEREGVLPW